jgi:hypothetical protein
MPRNVTVTFEDGTSHVYQNAPDDITPAQVEARAAKEFSRRVVGLNGGRGEAAPAPERTFGDTAKDIGITALKGAIGLPQAFAGLADIPTGGRVSKALEGAGLRFSEAQKALEEAYSPAQKEAMRRVGAAQGFLPTVKEAIVNPSVPLAAIGESLPQMLGGAGIARGLIAKGVPAIAAVGAGEGALGAGSAAAQMRAESPEGSLTPKQSAAALGLGAGAAVLGAAVAKFAKSIGLADVDTLIAKGGAEAAQAANAKMGFMKSVVGSGLAEGAFEEMPQSAQEQMWQNWAGDKPIFSGVPEAAGMGLVTGAIMGGTAGGVTAMGKPEAPKETEFDKRRKEMESAAPAAQYFDQASPLENPYGNIPADLMPDVTEEINAARSKRKQAPLDSFSIEDAVNAGIPQERVDTLLSGTLEKAGLFPDQEVAPQDVLDAAADRGVNPDQPGFKDFLRRATGSEDLDQMSPVQRVAAFGAIQNLPEGVDTLPTGTNARSFTEGQYKSGLKAIRSSISGGASRDSLLASIQKAGIKNPQDAQSILQNAIREGQVGAISTPAYAVFDDYGKVVRTYDDRGLADQAADRLNGSVTEVSQTSYVPPGQTEIPSGEATGYQIRVGDSVLASAKTPEEIDQKADRLGQIRERIAASRQSKVDQLRQQALRNTESLEELEARGLSETTEYAKKQKQIATDNAKIDRQIGQLTKEVEDAARPMFVSAIRPKVKRAAKAAPVKPAAKPAETPELSSLRQKLLPALRRFGLEGVGLRVVKSIEDGGAGADGAYANRLIQIAMSAENPMGVMRHEVIHALKELGAFKPREWRALEKRAKSEWVDKFIRQPGLYERYQQVYQEQAGSLEGFDEYIAEEAIAEAFKYFDQTKPPVGLIGNLFNRLRNFFASLRNAMQGAGFQTAEDVLGRIEEGKVMPTQAETSAAPKFSVPTRPEIKQALTRNITGEVIPSTKTEMARVSEVPMVVKQNLTDEILNSGIVQQMANLLGVRSEVKVTPGTGGYEGSITPNLIVQVFDPNPEVSANDAAKISAAMTYVFKQDAVPYFRADPRLINFDQRGYRITFGSDQLTETQERGIFNVLRSIMGDGAGYTKMSGNQMVLINYRGEDGKPFLMDDEAFASAVSQFKDTASDIVNVNNVEKFGVESEYPYHDWKDDAAGAGIIAGLQGRTGGRSDIQNGLDSLRKSFVDSARESVRSAGLEPRFSLSDKRGRLGDPRYGKRVTTDTIEVDGQDRPTRTSKGTLIYPTEEGVKNFWRWFGNSVFVDEDGRPLVMYHGTAADIEEFIPKQANAIFITPQVEFSAEFKGGVLTGVATWSENWMVEHYDEILSPDQIEAAKLEALENIDPETKRDYKLSKKAHHSAFVETSEFMQAIKDQLPSRANVIPLFVKSENPFNYSNENHVRQAVDRLFLDFGVDLEQDPNGRIRFMNEADSMADREYSENEVYNMLTKGYWPLIEQAEIQDVIRDLGFDGFSVQESLVKNYAVFDPNQVKSSVGNDGNFSDKKGIRFSIAQSKTPEFKRWFRESKVSDKSGKPILMYHSTPSPDDDIFSVFKRSDDGKLGQGIYTTSMERYAEGFAPTGAVMPLWVSIQNPLYLDLSSPIEKGRSPRDVLRAKMAGKEDSGKVDYLRLDGSGAKEISDRLSAEIKAISGRRLMDMSGATIRRTLQKAGYDGIIVRDADGNFVEVNAFEPTQIKSAVGNRGTFDETKKDIRYSFRNDIKSKLGQGALSAIDRTTSARQGNFSQRLASAFSPDSFTKLRRQMVNKYAALERNSKRVADRYGESRLLADQSAIAAALMSDRAAGIAAESFKNGVPVYAKGYTKVDDLGGKVKGLIPILEPLMKYNDPFVFQAFQFYSATRRGARLLVEGREKLLTLQDIRFGKQLEQTYPEFKAAFDEYQKYNRGLVKFLVDTGVLSEEMGKKWAMYADYIPFYRQADGEETIGPQIFNNLAGVKPTQRLKGGEFKLDDFLETVVRNTRSAIEQGMKNVAAQRAVKDAIDLNSPGKNDYAKRMPPGTAGAPDIVTVREKGKDVQYQVADPLLVETMKGFYMPNPYETILKIVGFPTRMLRELVTKMPDFMLANLMRDSMSAWVTSGTKFKPVIDSFKQAGNALVGSSPEIEAIKAAGIGTGYEFSGDVKSTAIEFAKELRKASGKRKVSEIALLPITKVWDLLDAGSNASDLATRAEIHKRTLAETGNEAEAAFRALEVMNFSRMGSSPLVQILSATVPFFNARVQGLDLLYRAGMGDLAQANRDAAHKAFKVRALTLFALSIAYWMMASDSDEYKKANEETRDNNWIIGPVRIPIPFEIGVLFKVVPERMMGYLFGTDTGKDVKESAKRNIVSTLSMNPVPQAVLPILENYIDYSFFTGRGVIPRGMEDVAPQFQEASATSTLAKKIGAATEYSPIKVDNLINGYFGAFGTYMSMGIDSMLRTASDPVKPAMGLEQMPVIKRFYASPLAGGTKEAFFDLKDRIGEVTRTQNFLMESGRYEELAAYMKENGRLIDAKSWVSRTDKELKNVRELIRATSNLTERDITPEEKREALNSLRRSENYLTEQSRILKKSLMP